MIRVLIFMKEDFLFASVWVKRVKKNSGEKP